MTTRKTREFGGVTFSANVAGTRCEACEETFVGYYALEVFELEVAADLARLGLRDGAAFKFQRKAIGYSAAEFAELLGVAPETVSRWETGRVELPSAVVATLGALVDEHVRGRTDTKDRLLALRAPAPRGTVRTLRDVPAAPPPAL